MDYQLEGEFLEPSPAGTADPVLVAPVEQLIQDVKALEELTRTSGRLSWKGRVNSVVLPWGCKWQRTVDEGGGHII